MNLERARYNMVEQQIRTWEVLNQRILDLIARAPREDYVPAAFRNLAFADMNIPIGHNEVMMQPKMEARLLQELEIKPTDKILEIGTGTGFLTSLLASLGKHVYSVDIHADFSRAALEKLAQHGHKNVTLEVGDAASGWTNHGPFDVIVLTGSVPVLSENFKNSLVPGGRLFAVVGKAPAMDALVIQRVGNGYSERSVFETVLPPLVNAKAPVAFTL